MSTFKGMPVGYPGAMDRLRQDRDKAREERDEAIEQRDRARAWACRLEEELALIRRAGRTRRA